MVGFRIAWALPVSPTCHPNGQGNVRCLAFRRIDPAFEPSLYQGQLPPSGNAIFQGRDKDPKTIPAIQSADCRDKMRAQIAANSGPTKRLSDARAKLLSYGRHAETEKWGKIVKFAGIKPE
jgi:hypothetical protein